MLILSMKKGANFSQYSVVTNAFCPNFGKTNSKNALYYPLCLREFHDFELTNAADSAILPYRQLKSREIIHCGISP